MIEREKLVFRATTDFLVPAYITQGLVNYILDGRDGGEFLNAVFKNDLMKSLSCADACERRRLYDICLFLYTHAPPRCYGSRLAFERWKQVGGWKGLERRKKEAGEDEVVG